MAGEPKASISQTFTSPVSGNSGGFDLTQFSKVTIVAGPETFTGAPTNPFYFEVQQQDGTWVRPFAAFTISNAITDYNTPFNAGRIAWDITGTGTVTVTISVWAHN
jgi:hypothetical protein